ncbi:DUF6471 domain-containing protein [Kordiimonas lipolytica]|uniref:DUF6471 domain-containing protein n=1 Tax=Kordiimonas lipolytica TaxID=1662421 RepID=A0ABV8UE33_9PROT|nr:DUF6471 domain-containing protein [Kordiimonas lipolytica]
MGDLTDEQWREALRLWLKAKLAEKGMGLPELAKRLADMGVELDRRTLSNKLNRVSFTAAFFLQVLEALGEEGCELKDIATYLQSSESRS